MCGLRPRLEYRQNTMGRFARTRAQRDATPPSRELQVPLNRIHIIRRCRGGRLSGKQPRQLGACCAKSHLLRALTTLPKPLVTFVRSSAQGSPTPTQIQHRPSRTLIVTIGLDERPEARAKQPTDRVASSRRRDRCVRADRVAPAPRVRAALFSLSTILEESRSEVHARARGRARRDHRARRVV